MECEQYEETGVAVDQMFCAAADEEGVQFDPEQLELLWGEMGEDRAEAFVREALSDLAARIATMGENYDRGEWRTLQGRAAGFAKLADRVGMTRSAQVARDVAICAGRGDRVALAATWARLDRLCAGVLGADRLPAPAGRSS